MSISCPRHQSASETFMSRLSNCVIVNGLYSSPHGKYVNSTQYICTQLTIWKTTKKQSYLQRVNQFPVEIVLYMLVLFIQLLCITLGEYLIKPNRKTKLISVYNGSARVCVCITRSRYLHETSILLTHKFIEVIHYKDNSYNMHVSHTRQKLRPNARKECFIT